MKVEKATGAGRAAAVTGAYVTRAGGAAAAAPASPVAPVSAEILGIPEGEFTPAVRTAIVTLMGEVERLRAEIEETRKRLEEAARTADQDTLLPVLNRRAFVREITRFIAFSERYGTPSSLLYFDLNNFKQVNDEHGHAAGDAVLRHFAEVLCGQVRDTDVVGRLGGDEFGVILAHISSEQASRKSEQLARALRTNPPKWQGQPLMLGFSVGTYELRSGENADDAMAHADQAMYVQKRALR